MSSASMATLRSYFAPSSVRNALQRATVASQPAPVAGATCGRPRR